MCVPYLHLLAVTSGGTRNFSVGGIEGKNAILRGQKSKNLPKMTDFGHVFPSDWGQVGGGRASDWGVFAPHAPLDAATGCDTNQRHIPV